MSSKSDTIDAEIEKLLLSFIEYANKDLPVDDWINDTKAKLKAPLLRERKAELERLFDANNGVMGSHYIYLTDDAADEIAKALRNRIAELSRLSREESHE